MNTQIRTRIPHPLLRPGRDDCAPAPQGESRVNDAAHRSTGAGVCASLSRVASLRESRTARTSMSLPIRFALAAGRRTKESIASVRHLYIDIDVDGDARLAALRASDAVPAPTCDSLHIARQVSGALAGRWLRLRAAGKHAQAARHRLRRRLRLHRLQPCSPRPRIPELQVRSRSPRHGRISLRFRSGHPDDFRLDDAVRRMPCASASRCRANIPIGKHSHSEQDWAWVVQQLAHGRGCREADAGAWLRAAPISPILSTTRSAPSTSLRLVSGLLEGMRDRRRDHHA